MDVGYATSVLVITGIHLKLGTHFSSTSSYFVLKDSDCYYFWYHIFDAHTVREDDDATKLMESNFVFMNVINFSFTNCSREYSPLIKVTLIFSVSTVP